MRLHTYGTTNLPILVLKVLVYFPRLLLLLKTASLLFPSKSLKGDSTTVFRKSENFKRIGLLLLIPHKPSKLNAGRKELTEIIFPEHYTWSLPDPCQLFNCCRSSIVPIAMRQVKALLLDVLIGLALCLRYVCGYNSS